jgi:isopentenyl-diphosphate delta-isomerase
MSRVLLVDSNDEVLGEEEKIAVHRLGLLHRAFSVVLTNGRGQLLLQRRASQKYHSGGLWANSCCGHPDRADAAVASAAEIRGWEELGIEVSLRPIFTTVYRARVSPDMTEFEFVHGFWAHCELSGRPDASEVSEVAWCELDDIASRIDRNAQLYAPWLIHYVRENDLIGQLRLRDAEV